MSAPLPPVVLLLFNRPTHTRQLLRALREIRPPVLYLIADGPRADVPGERERCEEVRAACAREIDWPAEVHRDFSAENLGLRERVGSGLSWVFSQVEEAIILEDDCVPAPSFFRYCADLLARYRHDERVGAISGDNFQPQPFACDASYYFSKYPHCWGWATWRRAWAHFDDRMALWPQLRAEGWLRSLFADAEDCAYWSEIFDGVHSRRLRSWAYAWTFACWAHSMLTALPKVNLVENIGFGEEATNTRKIANISSQGRELEFPLQDPERVGLFQPAEEYTQRHIFRTAVRPTKSPSWQRRLDSFWRRAQAHFGG